MARRRLEAAIRAGKEIDSKQRITTEPFKKVKHSMSINLDEKMMGAYSLQFTHDGDNLAIGCGNGGVLLANSHTGMIYKTLNPGSIVGLPVLCLAFHPENQQILLSAGSDGNISFWNTRDRQMIDNINEVGNEINSFDFSLDGDIYASAGKDLCVRIYSAENNKLLRKYEGGNSFLIDRDQASEVGHGMRIFALRFHPDENSIFVTGGWDNQLKIWDSRTASGVQLTIPGPHICGSGLDMKDGKILTASWTHQNALQLWDLSMGKLLQSIPFECDTKEGEFLYCCQFCDGDVVLAGGSGTNDAQAVNTNTFQNLGSISLDKKPVQALDSTNGGRLFAVGSTGSTVKLGNLS